MSWGSIRLSEQILGDPKSKGFVACVRRIQAARPVEVVQ